MTIRIAAWGARGRMGRLVAEFSEQDARFDLAALVEYEEHPDQGRSVTVGAEGRSLTVSSKLTDEVDVVVDFSSPSGFRRALVACVESGTAFISGTTGLGQDEEDLIVDASSRIPLVYEPNMSVGVEILSRLCREAASLLPEGFDAEIVEAHHGRKVDAPSGTALRLVDNLLDGCERWTKPVHGREGQVGPRSPAEVGVHAVRGGDVVGEHTVFLLGMGERIELTHRCTDRGVFVRGALHLATKLQGRGPGRYRMKDLL